VHSYHRKSLAAILLVVFFSVGLPSLGVAGGCDEPGYTGGSCKKIEGDASGGPPSAPPGKHRDGGGGKDPVRGKGNGSKPEEMTEGVTGLIHSWLTLLLGGLIH
jgi:hypothetical protein